MYFLRVCKNDFHNKSILFLSQNFIIVVGSLISLNTPNILYVDLNSILHANAVVLSEWYRLLGNKPRSSYYKRVANKLLTAIDAVSK